MDDIQQKLAQLRKNYLASLPDKLSQLKSLWSDLLANPDDSEQQQTTLRAFHTLAGSGTSFGLPEITELSREIENTIKACLKKNQTISNETVKEVEYILKKLLTLDLTPQDDEQQAIPENAHDAVIPVNQYLVCLLNFAPEQAMEIENQVNHYGYHARIAKDEKDLEELCLNGTPGALVCDFQENTACFPLTNELRCKLDNTPLIVISSENDTKSRLDAVRSGADAFFSSPVDYPFFIDTLDKLTNTQTQNPYRVLIMDDSPSTADFYSYTLQTAGMMTYVVTDPLNIMEELDIFSPELILMDLYMPHCSGTELSAVIRQQEHYVGTPIVFLSSETNIDKQNQAMSQGGDDFLTKPIKAEHLVSAVKTRAERYRKLRSLMIRDSLTGLLNHTTTTEMLERELSRISRANGDLSYAMIDIDFFKKVNDNYGHSIGDQVIKILARLLKQRLRRTDIIGRYGGEEFAVIMPDTKPAIAVRVIDEIRQSFSKIDLSGKASGIHLSFSAGVAGYPYYKESNLLNDAADRALYQAKHKGRNCVLLLQDKADSD